MAVDFADTFDRADSATVGNGWAQSGTAAIASNQLSLNNGQVTQVIADTGRAEITIPNPIPAGTASVTAERWILFRYQDTSNFWFFGVNAGVYQAFKCTGGGFLEIFNSATAPVAGDRIAVSFTPTAVRFYRNGVELSSSADTGHSAATGVGLRTRTVEDVRFDNFNYWVKTDGTATDATAPVVTATPSGGTYTTAQSVTLTADEPATIYYTTDGTTPTATSTVYSAAISISVTTTLKYFGRDTAGNDSTVQTQLYTINSDTTPPTVSLTAPADGATIKGTVTVSADASDDVGVASVTFKHGTTTIGTADTTSPYSVSWDTKTVPNGDYVLTATAVDAAGNSTVSASRTVTVKNVTGSKKGSGSSKTTGTTLTVPVSTSVPVGDVMVVSGTADGSGVLSSIADTKGNEYTVARTRVHAVAAMSHSVAVSRIVNALVGGTDSVTLTFSASSSIRVGVLDSLSGSEGGGVQAAADNVGTGVAPDATITPGSGTPTLVASTGYVGDPAVIAYSAGVGFTEMAPEVGTAGSAPNRASGSQMAQDATAGAQGSAAVLGTSTDWVHIVLALSLIEAPVLVPGGEKAALFRIKQRNTPSWQGWRTQGNARRGR